ncbi:MAG: efflux RND transporter periplasmic adaptor subunit [Magnetospiraceae bacterium]
MLLIIPVVLGVMVFVMTQRGKEPPPRGDMSEHTRKVRVVAAQSLGVVPRYIGHGTVAPDRTWNAVAEVSGRVVFAHEKLRDGNIFQAGTELVRIDPTTYELAIAKINAEIAQLEIQERSARSLREIEARNLALAEQDLARKQQLRASGATAQSTVDAAEQGVLQYQKSLQDLENTLALVPAQRAVLAASLAQAELDLENTVIKAPFAIRAADVAVEEALYVSRGQVLFSGDAIDRVEVAVQVPPSRMRTLVMVGENLPDLPPEQLTDKVTEVVEIGAVVRLDIGAQPVEWPARFTRLLDTVDPVTRTVGVVVTVEDPFKDVEPGVRPPLTKGMFVDVELRGGKQPDRVVIPREAVRDGIVYVVDGDNRLAASPVSILFDQGSFVVVAKGVEAGQQVVVSDLVPAVIGTKLDPTEDTDLAVALEAAASGESPE